MKYIFRKGKYIYFEGFNNNELGIIKKLLTAYDYDYVKKKQIPVNMLFTNDYLPYTLFGYLDYLKEKLPNYDIDFQVIEEEKGSIDLSEEDLEKIKNLAPNYQLRPYQVNAVVKCLYHKFGNVVSATGSGKTLMMASLVKYLDLPAVVVVPTIQLAEQLYHNFTENYQLEGVSIIQGKRKEKGKIMIGVANSILNTIKRNPEMFEDVKILLYDEAHSRQASTWIAIDNFFQNKVEYNIGFTGSIYRYSKELEKYKKLEDWIMYGLTGRKPIINIDYKFLINHKYLSTPYIYVETINHPKISYKDWQKVLKELVVKNKKRNDKIKEWIEYFYYNNLTPILVLVDRIDHLTEIFDILPEDIKDDSIALMGNKTAMKYYYGDLQKIKISNYNDIIEKVNNNEYKVLFGTTVLKQGTDIPEIKSLILAYSGKSEVSVKQKLGRALRITPNKDKVFIVDFFDDTHRYLRNHSYYRINFYKEQEFPIFYSVKKGDLEKFKDLTTNQDYGKIYT